MQSKFGTMLKKGPFTNKRHEAAGGIVAPDVLTTSKTQISDQSVSFSEASHSAFMHQEKFAILGQMLDKIAKISLAYLFVKRDSKAMQLLA